MRYTLLVSERVLGVLGGNDVVVEHLVSWCRSADVIYATDSGADRIIALGFAPVVVGDFDSFSSLDAAAHLRLEQSSCQDTTDCDKLLRLAVQDGHRSITIAASEGDLPDHVLSTFFSALRSDITVRFAFRRGLGSLVNGGREQTVSTSTGQRVSLMPLTSCHGVSLSGTRWPLTSEDIAPEGLVSISNEALGSEVSVRIESGSALLFIETGEIYW